MSAWDIILLAVAVALAVPLVVLTVECVAALLPVRRPEDAAGAIRPSIAVIVPAHNEVIGIARTLDALRPQLAAGDRLLVVADNCTDGTAALASQFGAEVAERFDAEHRGKGYAISFGVAHLASDPPDVVIIMDADCEVATGSLHDLAREAMSTKRPAQAIYLIDAPQDGNREPGSGNRLPISDSRLPSRRTLVSAFAVMVKNLVRPRGLHALKQPCLLTGSGMAFPWALLGHQGSKTSRHRAGELDASMPLASMPSFGGHIVEDMKLGIDLALAGSPPLWVPQVTVRSELPTGSEASTSQRTRWEHGHLSTLLREGPRLLIGSIVKRRLYLFVLALELCVPPLSLHLILTVGALAGCSIAYIFGWSILPLIVLSSAAIFAGVALGFAWFRFARQSIPFNALLTAPIYMLSKIPLYARFLFRPQTDWIRTPRSEEVLSSESWVLSAQDSRLKTPQKVLAISSGGGHWIELLRLRSAFDECELVFATVQRDYERDVAGCRFRLINDATRWNRIALVRLALRVLMILLIERPNTIVTTGAAPGYFALRFGKMLGAKTIWLDSIANVEELSMSGRMAGRFADLWLTQWSELACEDGPHYAGVVL